MEDKHPFCRGSVWRRTCQHQPGPCHRAYCLYRIQQLQSDNPYKAVQTCCLWPCKTPAQIMTHSCTPVHTVRGLSHSSTNGATSSLGVCLPPILQIMFSTRKPRHYVLSTQPRAKNLFLSLHRRTASHSIAHPQNLPARSRSWQHIYSLHSCQHTTWPSPATPHQSNQPRSPSIAQQPFHVFRCSTPY